MSLIDHRSPATTAASRNKLRRGELVGRFGPAGGVVVLSIIFAVLNPSTFPTKGNVLTMIDQTALPLIITAGLSFVVLMGSVDLSIEGVMAAAGLTFVLLSANSANSFNLGVLALLIAVLVGVGFGFLNGYIHTAFRVPSFILTLGTWYSRSGYRFGSIR